MVHGIDPEIFPRLFTKFATKSDRGTGLGLFICKSIIEAHGGKIWAQNNTDGIGATFALSLPLVIQQDHHYPQESITIDPSIASPHYHHHHTKTITAMVDDTQDSHKTKIKRIFLVDDDYDHTVTFKVGLELAGFEVDAYNDSTIALSNFKKDYYDLLLIDIKLPKINGFELYEKIREIDDKVKVWFTKASKRQL